MPTREYVAQQSICSLGTGNMPVAFFAWYWDFRFPIFIALVLQVFQLWDFGLSLVPPALASRTPKITTDVQLKLLGY
jgi:hypothetical protein